MCAIICFGLSQIYAGTIDPNTPDSKYLEYGKKHECVVQLSGLYGENKSSYKGSAVIIKPRIALTAAHVVQKATDCVISVNDTKIKILFAVILKEYNEDNIGPYDIAICFLERDAIIGFYPELYSDNDEVGKICSIAGYGFTGTYNKGISRYDDKKRAGSNIIDGITCGMLVCSVNKSPKTSLEFLIATGDSGGGLFIDQKLAGIHSCIMTDDGKLDSNYNEDSLHTRISIHKSWIEDISSNIEKYAPLIDKSLDKE